MERDSEGRKGKLMDREKNKRRIERNLERKGKHMSGEGGKGGTKGGNVEKKKKIGNSERKEHRIRGEGKRKA